MLLELTWVVVYPRIPCSLSQHNKLYKFARIALVRNMFFFGSIISCIGCMHCFGLVIHRILSNRSNVSVLGKLSYGVQTLPGCVMIDLE
jgi:hypothetical protein